MNDISEHMPELQKRKKESYQIFNKIAPTYDFLNRLLSFGIDRYWRKKIIDVLPEKETREATTNSLEILDLATGTADVPLTLVKSPKIKHIKGIDLSTHMLEIGKRKVIKKNLEDKILLMKGDATNILFPNESFDVVTISFGIRNFDNPEKCLHEIYRVLKSTGRVIITEFALPKNPIIKLTYIFYFRYFLPFIGNLISQHKDAYTYLNKTVEDFPYGENFLKLMSEAKFHDLKMRPMTFGIAMQYTGDKKSKQ